MRIDSNSWHFKVYAWQRSCMDNDVKTTINLCPYVRIVLFWAPLQWLLFAGKIIPRVYNFFVWLTLGIVLGGYALYHRSQGDFFLALLFITVIGTVASIFALISYYMEHGGKHMISSLAPVQLVTEYAEAAHSRICPLIEVK